FVGSPWQRSYKVARHETHQPVGFVRRTDPLTAVVEEQLQKPVAAQIYGLRRGKLRSGYLHQEAQLVAAAPPARPRFAGGQPRAACIPGRAGIAFVAVLDDWKVDGAA